MMFLITKNKCFARLKFFVLLIVFFFFFYLQNTPNDLQLLSDAPAHHIFCLLGPLSADSTQLPEVLCALQVSLLIFGKLFYLFAVIDCFEKLMSRSCREYMYFKCCTSSALVIL